MATVFLYLFLFSLTMTQACEVFIGVSCTCYESIDLRCTMAKWTPLAFVSSSVPLTKKYYSIDLKIDSDENVQLNSNAFILLNQLLPNTTRNTLSLTFRFQSFKSFHAKASSFANLFIGITSPHKRLTIELHPLQTKSIIFDANTFAHLQVNELSLYGDSLTSSFESIFNQTNITHLNIEGAIVAHDSSLVKDFQGRIQSLKITRMIDTVNSDEFPPFPVQSYTIEAHKMRTLDALSFINYTQLTGINIIQPDVSITPKILAGLENLSNLKSLSFDAERIANGALKHIKHIHTLILGSYLKILDTESLNSLKSLQQLDVRYVQFSNLQGNTSCDLADYINRRRMMGLNVYLPDENPDCDCILVFLNNMAGDGSQLYNCQSATNDRCLFSSCSIVSEYFTRKQKEDLEQDQQEQPGQIPEIEQDEQDNRPPAITPSQSSSSSLPFQPPSIDFNDNDSPYYPDGNQIDDTDLSQSSSISPIEPSIYDDEEDGGDGEMGPTRRTTLNRQDGYLITDPDASENEFSTPMMQRVHPDGKKYRKNSYMVVSWIPFAVIGSCLFLSLIIAMISYVIYHKRRTTSFKLVPQAAPII